MGHFLFGKNISLTPAIEVLVDKKIKALNRFLLSFAPETIEARIEVGKPSKHHRSGMVFYAEINLKLAGVLLRAESFQSDLNFAVNEAFRDLERQVKKYKEKLQTTKRQKTNPPIFS